MDPSLFFAGDLLKRNLANYLEPHSKIEFDGVIVRAANIEPGHKAVATMISRELPDDARGETLATMQWMRTDAADLRVAHHKRKS